jgi:hypothetical protein
MPPISPGVTAPALKGDRFQMTWGGDTVEGLFGKIRDTMPPNFGTVVGDQAKLDVVAFILQTNGYPAGSTELVLDSPDLAASQILKKGEQACGAELLAGADRRLPLARAR